MNEQELKFILTLKPRYFTVFLHCLLREGAEYRTSDHRSKRMRKELRRKE